MKAILSQGAGFKRNIATDTGSSKQGFQDGAVAVSFERFFAEEVIL